MTSVPHRRSIVIGGASVAVAVTGASLFPGLPIELGIGSLRLGQIVTLLLVPWWLLTVPTRQTRVSGYEAAFVLMVAIWIAANFASSALAPEEPLRSIRLAVWPVLSFLTFLVVRAAIDSRRALDRVVQTMLLGGAVFSAYAVFAVAALRAGLPLPGIRVRDGEFFGAFAAMHEPNILGSFLVILAALALAGYLFRPRTSHLILFALYSGAIVLTFTRAAIGSLAITACLLIILKLWKTGRLIARKRALMLGFAGVAALSFTIFAASELTLLGTKLTSLDIEGNTLRMRLTKNLDALGEWSDRPVLGYGTDAFGTTRIAPGTVSTPDWLGTQVVQSIYDTGLIGLIAYVGFMIAVIAKALAQFLASREPRDTALAAGVLVALVVTHGVTYQFTTALWFGFNWVLFAIAFALRTRAAPAGAEGILRNHQRLAP